MTDVELLSLARSASDNITSDFSQVITINFGMVIAIYYFLNEAKIGIRIFAFVVYLIGMLMYLGVMLVETNVYAAALDALRALPAGANSLPAQRYVALNDSWLFTATRVMKNLSLWVLIFGVGYLLFFWRKLDHLRRDSEAAPAKRR